VSDFATALAQAGKGDFVYLDPPYDPVSTTASFTSYTPSDFDREDQKRLSEIYRRLDRRGALLMLSNSATPLIRELYGDYNIIEVQARRAINSRGDRRGPVTELLILNYDPKHVAGAKK
jgi:DNA adenine methylase